MNNIINHLDGSVWAMYEPKMQEIVSFIEGVSYDKALDLHSQETPFEQEEEEENDGFKQVGSTAVVEVRGTIAKRMNMFMKFSGGTSTEKLANTLRGLKENDEIESVVLDIDSPGGSVEGLTEVAKAVRSLREEKEVISVANDMMASAAYYIGSAADFIYATPNAMVGSIGTMALMRSDAKKHEEEGVEFNIVRSAPKKAVNHRAEPITEEGVKEMQRVVDQFNQEFIRNVALNLNIDMSDAEQLADGRVFVGVEAVKEGLADGLATIDEVLEEAGEAADAEERVQVFKSALEETRETFRNYEASAQKVIAEKEDRIEELESQLAEQEARELEQKVNSFTEELIEKGKIVPAKAEAVKDQLREDFEGTKATFEAVPEGKASPDEFEQAEEAEDIDEGSLEAQIEQAKEEGKKIAQSEDQAEVYEDFDIDYFPAYEYK